jgi:hydrogenase maturation protease
LPDVTVDINYQLSVEDADEVARHDAVVFVDAAVAGKEPFDFRVLEPKFQVSFSTHSVAADALLGLAHDLFDGQTPGFLLAIRGYEFEMFSESVSERAQSNLAAAIDFLVPVLQSGQLAAAAEDNKKAENQTG